MAVAILNYTPHPVNLIREDVIDVFESRGVARCQEIIEEAEPLNGIPTMKIRYGTVEGLPDPLDGVFYIVSLMVRLARPQRYDLLSPGEVVRNQDGSIVGCKNFIRNGCI